MSNTGWPALCKSIVLSDKLELVTPPERDIGADSDVRLNYRRRLRASNLNEVVLVAVLSVTVFVLKG